MPLFTHNNNHWIIIRRVIFFNVCHYKPYYNFTYDSTNVLKFCK